MDKKSLGERIKAARKEVNLTQVELSNLTGLSRNYISDIENGRYAPSSFSLFRLAIALKIDLNLLKNDVNTIQGGAGNESTIK